jgi:superfamily II DNA/RNA helicase
LGEADRMLDMGFELQIRKLVLKSGDTRKRRRRLCFLRRFRPRFNSWQSVFFFARTFGYVGRVGSTMSNITQVIVKATPEKKLQLVVETIRVLPVNLCLCKERTITAEGKRLTKGGPDDGKTIVLPIPAEDIHGQISRRGSVAKLR